MNLQDLRLKDEQYQLQAGPRVAFAPLRGEGAYLYDATGERLLDFSESAIGSCLGYGNSALVDALMDQALALGSATPRLYEATQLRLAEELCLRGGFSKSLFCSSGEESLRLMVGLARRYSALRYGPERRRILTLRGGSAPQDADFLVADAGLDSLRAQDTQDVCAVLFQPVPQGGNMDMLPRQLVHDLAILCAEQDLLLLCDENRSCGGQTGTLFASAQYGISPDLLCFSSTLSAGLPLGGVLLGNRCCPLLEKEAETPFSTGANPICAAAALSILSSLHEEFLAQVREKGDYLREALEGLCLPAFDGFHGSGLMVGLSVSNKQSPRQLCERLRKQGLLCDYGRKELFLRPPLGVRTEELDEAIQLIELAVR